MPCSVIPWNVLNYLIVYWYMKDKSLRFALLTLIDLAFQKILWISVSSTLWVALLFIIDLSFLEYFINFREPLTKTLTTWTQNPLIPCWKPKRTDLYGQTVIFPTYDERVLSKSSIKTMIHACARFCASVYWSF